MDKKFIITIGREYGSGGHEIGERLAEDYNIPFYDKELIARAAKESGISEELFQVVEEQQTTSFLYSLAMGAYSYASRVSAAGTVSMSDRLFLIQTDLIKKIADEGSCVIVGRCADYILREREDVVSVFIYSDLENRIDKICLRENISDKKARDLVNKMDKKRSSYYNYYTNKKWGRNENIHMSIDSSVLGIDGTVELIKKFIEIKNNI